MLVLVAALFLAACGVLVLVFRRRIQSNLPVVKYPRRRQLHSGSPGTITGVGVAFLVIAAVAGLVYALFYA